MIAMPSLKASPAGLKKIEEAITRISAERGWARYDEYWLEEASNLLPNAEYISCATWNRFLSGKQSIKAVSFKAFCDLLGLNWEEIIDTYMDA
jgi:hypothetical protein